MAATPADHVTAVRSLALREGPPLPQGWRKDSQLIVERSQGNPAGARSGSGCLVDAHAGSAHAERPSLRTRPFLPETGGGAAWRRGSRLRMRPSLTGFEMASLLTWARLR